MASSGGSRKSSRIGGEGVTTMRKERRFEDIVSDEDDDDDVMPIFLQKGKESSSSSSTSASYPNKRSHNSPPRKPRSTLHEQVGEDGFIFSIAGPSTSKTATSRIPGAKGPPPSSGTELHQTTVRERIAEAETPVIRRNQQKRKEVDGLLSSASDDEQHFRPSTTQKRQPSDSVKRIRRTSLLKDGTPAYPHPSISDADLHNYCSADLESEERMKHVAGWILERRLKDVKSSKVLQQKNAEAYRGALLAALKATLRDLNKGRFETQRDSSHKHQSQASSSANSTSVLNGVGKDKMTPNARNRKKKVELEEVVQNLKREKADWEKEQKELDRLKQEIDILSREGDEVDDASIEHIMDMIEDGQWSAEERQQLEMCKRVLDRGNDKASSGSSRARAAEHLSLLGTEADPRWKDVEFNADLLLSKTHTFAQLSSLSQRYIAAVSARGAKALKEMTEGPSRKLRSLQGIGGSASSSIISRESRDNLDQILSEIRTFEDDASDEEGGPDRGIGEVSEGEILRAYAQMS